MISASKYRPNAIGKRTKRSEPTRSGAVLLAVMVCMFVSIALIGSALKSSVTARRQCRMALQMQQAVLLLEYGVNRVAELPISELDPDTTLASLDVSESLKDFSFARIEYALLETPAKEEARVRCTVRLGHSLTSNPEIQLSREIPFPSPSFTVPALPADGETTDEN
jgi:hypothetical protein